MTRQEFTQMYLVALYQVHRQNRDSLATVESLQQDFELPRDQYLEDELPEMLEHRSWASIERSTPARSSWLMRITMLGKEAAEAQIDNGIQVYPITHASIPTPASPEQTAIPAADRMVALNDNHPDVVSARETLLNLSNALGSGNDVGSLSELEVEEARREVYLLEQAIAAEAVRVDWLEPFAMKSLKWIADKAGGSIVGTLAVAALAAIIKIMI